MEDIVDKEELLQALIIDVRKKVKNADNSPSRSKKLNAERAQHALKGLQNEIDSYQRAIDQKGYKNNRLKEFNREITSLQKDMAKIRSSFEEEDQKLPDHKKDPQNIQVVINKARQAQSEMHQMAQNMLRDIHQANEIADNVNLELDQQIEQLDRIYNQTKDTESELERAEKHLRYFARQVYTDKILMCMLVLVVLAIIAVIILTIVKGGGSLDLQDAILN